MSALLDGFRVVDLTDLRGALAGRLLADMGASVIRIVEPTLARATDTEEAQVFRNANKTMQRMRLDDGPGRSALDDLLSHADVVVENLDQELRSRWDLQPSATAARHPHLVHVTMADMGLSGDRAGWRLEPLTAAAASGAQHASGFPALPPCAPTGYLAHDCASAFATIGAVAAVMDRRRAGTGQHIEVSTQEAALSGLIPWSIPIPDYLHINPALPEQGTRNADGTYYVLPAKDGYVRSVLGNRPHWDGFLELCGRPELLLGEEWAQPGFRLENADVFKLVVGDSLADRTRQELADEAKRVGATVGVIQLPSEYVAHPQTTHRQPFEVVDGELIASAPVVVDRHRERVGSHGSFENVTATRWTTPGPWRATGGALEGNLLLDGIRVVEFGVAAVVPELNFMLSEFGADVVKVESASHPDILRRTGLGQINCGFAFNAECRGRRSVAIDLSTDTGRDLALDLCRKADVVTENHRGTVMDRLGLGEAAVRAANPSVVYVSSQGYGLGGPLGDMAAFGPLNSAFVGVHHLWNHPEAPYPCGTSLNHPDHIAGKLAGAWVLAALDRRARTGEGAFIEMAQTEVAAYLMGDLFVGLHRTGIDPQPVGNSSNLAAPHNLYPAAGDDAWVAIVCTSDADFAQLCTVVDIDGSRWPTLSGRLDARATIDLQLASWTSLRTPADAAELLQGAGVSAMPVMGPVDHRSDPHLAQRHALVSLDHPAAGCERHVANPLRPSSLHLRTAGPAPMLGQHTEEVLLELGLTMPEIDELVVAGICT